MGIMNGMRWEKNRRGGDFLVVFCDADGENKQDKAASLA
jgi:hypothetical protein